MARIVTIEEAVTVLVPGKRGKHATDFGAIVAEFAKFKSGESWIERYSTMQSVTNKKGTGWLDRFKLAADAAGVKYTVKPPETGASKSVYVTVVKV
jgi:hypothetical protein